MTAAAQLMAPLGAFAWLPCTLLIYSASLALHRRMNKACWVNPTLLTVLAINAILMGCGGSSDDSYAGGVDILHQLLGTAMVALAIPLHRNIGRLRGRAIGMAAALLAGSLACVVVGLEVAQLLGASQPTMLSLAPKSATTAASTEISRLIGGIPAVTAVATICCGIVGAVAGPCVLDLLGVEAPEARGFALGVAGAGIGTARAFVDGDIAGSFAALGMVLNATLTAMLVPALVRLAGYG